MLVRHGHGEQLGTLTCLDWNQDSTCGTYRICTKYHTDDSQNTTNPFLVPGMKFPTQIKSIFYANAALNTSPWNAHGAELDGQHLAMKQ